MSSWGRGVQLLSVWAKQVRELCVSLRFGYYRMVRGLGGGSPGLTRYFTKVYILLSVATACVILICISAL